MNKLIPILHNVRSLHNVGSILRTCDGLGVREVWVSGITPYPSQPGDTRLPHVALRATNQIAKTALGAENNVKVRHFPDINSLEKEVKDKNIELVAVEQTAKSQNLTSFHPKAGTTCLVFGNEVDGLDKNMLSICSSAIEIPMKGKKESLNVSIAVAIVLYALKHCS